MKKILIFEDKDQKNDFVNAVESVKNQANNLINTFHEYQSFKRIETIQDFENLCLGPVGFFDTVISNNIPLQKNQLEINVQKMCELFSIDRPGYLESLDLLGSGTIDNCQDCPKSRRRVKESVISYSQFLTYSDFLTFANGYFVQDQERISAKLESYNHFAESPEQIKLYRTWETLLNTLNDLMNQKLTGPGTLDKISKLLPGIKIVDNVLYLNMETIKNQILKLK